MQNLLPVWYGPLKNKYPIITEEEWCLLHKIAVLEHIKKGGTFLKMGNVSHFSGFVVTGAFKFSIQDEDANEKIIRFSFSNDFLANCDSYNKKKPSIISIIALEDASILKIKTKKLETLCNKHANLRRMHLQLYQELLEQQSEHQHILSLKSPVRRYRYLLERRPVIIQKTTLTNVARYLYVSREALSRARLSLAR
jgi:CRP-like cAMP-binding protein